MKKRYLHLLSSRTIIAIILNGYEEIDGITENITCLSHEKFQTYQKIVNALTQTHSNFPGIFNCSIVKESGSTPIPVYNNYINIILIQ